jgi:hypothetical protein
MRVDVSPEEQALMEAADKEAARRHLLPYIERINPNYLAAPHHVFNCEVLELFEWGVLPRLMVNEPPRHGKSMIISQYFPAWYLGRHPNHNFITMSYAQALANYFSEQARDQLKSDQWPFDKSNPKGEVTLSRRAGIEEWHTNKNGMFLPIGLDSGVTGRGAHVLSVDDPHKKGDSPVEFENVWKWYGPQAYTRMFPEGKIVITQTRWGDLDLSGRLLTIAEAGGEQWCVIKMPALSPTAAVFVEMSIPDDVAAHAGLDGEQALGMSEVMGKLRAIAKAQTEPAKITE